MTISIDDPHTTPQATLSAAKMLFFYIGNLSANAWTDSKNIEPLFRRIHEYAKDGEAKCEAALEKATNG